MTGALGFKLVTDCAAVDAFMNAGSYSAFAAKSKPG